MITDRELLELAAKAAGINLYVWGTPGSENFADVDATPYGRLWNPLTDDGDALRLAVHLEIGAMVSANFVYVKKYYSDLPILRLPIDGDKYAATRRAIVRAAAEVGKGMLSHDEFVLMFPDRFLPEDVERARAAAEIGKAMP